MRGFQGLYGQWTMWGRWEERIWLLTFFNSKPQHFYAAVKTSQRALPSKTQGLQGNCKRRLNECHVRSGNIWPSILEHTWSFCMTSIAWFFRWFLSAQWCRDSASSLPGFTSGVSSRVSVPFSFKDREYSLQSSKSSVSSIVNNEFPLASVWGFFKADWEELILDSETDFTLFFNLLTDGFLFTDALCSVAITAITGLVFSSVEVMGGLHRFPFTFFHFWDLAWPLPGEGFFTFMFLSSTNCSCGL